jgi:enterochelin esterase-like enzyme
MPVAARPSRTQVWLESLGDWSWPGEGGAGAAEALPPPWVPAFPPRREPAPAIPAGSGAQRASRARRLTIGVLLSALAAVCLALALHDRLTLSHPGANVSAHRSGVKPYPVSVSAPPVIALPQLEQVNEDEDGSSIYTATYQSQALNGPGSFLAYLPPKYSSSARYPVVYMLTGNDQSNTAFLQIGLQRQLDELIVSHQIPPVIAVMIQGGPGSNNWRDLGSAHYESYVVEVQELIDRTLSTIPTRDARAVVGDSMGAYGAMHTALAYPYRFGTVESWLGFFNGLEGTLRADRPIFAKLGLHAFVYGGEQDHIANPDEDAPFAAALRSAGADAHSAIYPGEHNLATLEAHLTSMLLFVGRYLRQGEEQAEPHPAPGRTADPTQLRGAG